MIKKVRVTRNVASGDPHNYYPHSVRKGEEFWTFHGRTFGCVSTGGIALSERAGEGPFFEFPLDALEDVEDEKPVYKGMGTR